MEEQEKDIEILNSNQEEIHTIDTIDLTDTKINDNSSNSEIICEKCTSSELDNERNSKKNNIDCIFRIAFNDEGRFNELKDGIIKSLSTFFETQRIDIEFIEDVNFLNISVIKKLTTDEVPLFMISVDTTPKMASQCESIPSYRRSIKDVLDVGKLNENNNNNNIDQCERPKTNLCFNCSGSHALKDCPEPRNQQKINKARKQYLSKNERYHIDVDQRLAHLKPGKLSRSLKNALGLQSRELPSFFYRMRVLGYPPGWLEDSKIANSGISLIDSEKNTVVTSDNDEGHYQSLEQQYDRSKIISFPGFNSDPGSGYYDDYKYHNVPAMHSLQKKEIFMDSLNSVTQSYKRRKINIPISNSTEKNNSKSFYAQEIESKVRRLNNQEDFERNSLNNDHIEEPLIIESHENNTIQITETKTETNSRNSPSLDDLQEQQMQLLEALQKSSCSIVSEESFVDETNLNINCDTESIKENDNILRTPQHNISSSSNKKLSVLGTPVLKFSIFDQLPKGENFKEGVSDVINFENLPDSTGKYEEMKLVLNKIRTKINELNDNQKN